MQIDVAREKTQYFEKLAIGTGATIAAIVAFLGSHVGALRPGWILRCALISLVVGLFAALYRNLRLLSYLLAEKECSVLEESREEQQRKSDLFQVECGTMGLHSYKPMDLQIWNAGFVRSHSELEILIQKRRKRIDRLMIEWRLAEYGCLCSICLAMGSLVWLAFRNF